MQTSDRKIFATLFFSIFTVITGVGVVIPLLPVYARELGAGGFYISLIFAAFSVSRTVFLPYFGRSSDRKGRKPFIVTGLFSYAMISLAFMFSDTVESLIFLRFVQGIASAMLLPVIQAYVGDITPENREGATMGAFNMSLFLGLSIGPLAGGTIKDMFGLDFSFLCMGLSSFASFFMSLFLLPPTRSERIVRHRREPVKWKHLLRDRDIAALFFFKFAYTACIGIIWSFLPIFADTEFSLSASAIGVLVIPGILVSGLMQTPMGFLADRLDKNRMLMIGGLIAAYAMLSFQWAGGFRDLFLAGCLFGVGGGVSNPPHSAITVRKGNRSSAMGSVISLMTMGHSLGMMAGSLLAGLMMDRFDLRHAFSSGSLVMLVGVILFFFCASREKSLPQTVG